MANKDSFLLPNINDGRVFVSPILGCKGACSYCYLGIHDFDIPRKNEISIEDVSNFVQSCPDFTFGRNGTIISVGAWGDIFPRDNEEFTMHSVQMICDLLSWENPVQIMSKNTLTQELIKKIADSVKYNGQLLYSTTITTIKEWRRIEPLTASPIDRLQTCYDFHGFGIPTNVLLKPFIPQLTGNEIAAIADLMIDYSIDYCTLGVMYWSQEIAEKVSHNKFLLSKLDVDPVREDNHLDCNGDVLLRASSVDELLPYLQYLRSRGVSALLKSSCVSSNVLGQPNASDYFMTQSKYCIHCGNCCCE